MKASQEKQDSYTLAGVASVVSRAEDLAEAEAPAFAETRLLAAGKFAELPWPGQKDEEWRRSSVSAFDFDSLKSLADGQAGAVETVSFEAHPLPAWLCRPGDVLVSDSCVELGETDFAALVRVRSDGREGPSTTVFLSPKARAAGLKIAALGDVFSSVTSDRVPESAKKKFLALYQEAVKSADNKFQFWNLAAWDSGIAIYAPSFAELKEDIVVDWQFSGEERVFQPLVFLVSEDGARLGVLERFSGEGGFFVNAGFYASVAPSAALRRSLLQELGSEAVLVQHGKALVERDGSFVSAEAHLGAGWVKGRVACDLNGPGTEAHLEGLYFGEDTQHVDLRTVQNHNAPRAFSRSLYKGVVKDEARTVYQGLIYVAPHAPKTDAYLTNRNLVLNDGARADSIPSLKIETDDVKCSHGSTTGRLAADQVFYLESRGFSKTDAEKMLITAYLDEVSLSMPELVREHLHGRVEELLGSGAT